MKPGLQGAALVRASGTAGEAVVVADESERIIWANEAFTQVTGLHREEAIGRTLVSLFARYEGPDRAEDIANCIRQYGHWQGELFKTVDGKRKTSWFAVTAINDGLDKPSGYVAIAWDSRPGGGHNDSAQEHFSKRLLTRQAFMDRAEAEISRARKNTGSVALLCLKLKHSGEIAKTPDAQTGADIVASVAERLGEADVVAALGEEEFGVLCVGTGPWELGRLAEEAVSEVDRLLDGREKEVRCSPSLGISNFPDDGDDPQVLLRKAGLAMRYAQRQARQGYASFSSPGYGRALDPLGVIDDLSDALRRDEFTLVYQPVYDLSSARVVSAEALVRWEHPKLGKLRPSQFMDVATEVGVWNEIGQRVLEQASKQVAQWADLGVPTSVSVNLSTQELLDASLPKRIELALGEAGVEARDFSAELAHESVTQLERTNRVSQLHSRGISVSLDDFGKGDPSLRDLRSACVDRVKIDPAIIKAAISNDEDALFLEGLFTEADGAGVQVVAKGVETRHQLDRLVRLGCQYAQGRFLCKPKKADWLTIVLLQDNAS